SGCCCSRFLTACRRLAVVGTGHARDTSAARWLFPALQAVSPVGLIGCHCMAAYAGLRLPPWMAEMPVLQEQKPALRPSARGGIPLRTPLARVPALSSFTKPN